VDYWCLLVTHGIGYEWNFIMVRKHYFNVFNFMLLHHIHSHSFTIDSWWKILLASGWSIHSVDLNRFYIHYNPKASLHSKNRHDFGERRRHLSWKPNLMEIICLYRHFSVYHHCKIYNVSYCFEATRSIFQQNCLKLPEYDLLRKWRGHTRINNWKTKL